MTTLTEKGTSTAKKRSPSPNFIRDTRVKHVKDDMTLKQQMDTIKEEIDFTKRTMAEFSRRPGADRTRCDHHRRQDEARRGDGPAQLPRRRGELASRNTNCGRGRIKTRLSWNIWPSVGQRTGESWDKVVLTLSTAQPMLSAEPPDLRALEVSITAVGTALAARPPIAPGGGQGGGAFEGADVTVVPAAGAVRSRISTRNRRH